jgi:hypothetical protein
MEAAGTAGLVNRPGPPAGVQTLLPAAAGRAHPARGKSMDDDDFDFDPGSFTFTCPVWICVQRTAAQPTPFGGNLEDGGKFVALFTDGDLAARFVQARGESGNADILNIPDPEHFQGLLRELREVGFTHAMFDHPGTGDQPRNLVPIEELIRQTEG